MPRGWTELSGVERVGVYTRQSLYVLLWSFSTFLLVTAVVDPDADAAVAPLIGGGAVVAVLGFLALRAAFAQFPAIPWRHVAPLIAASAVYYVVAVVAWEGTARGAAVTIVVTCLSLTLGMQPDRRILTGLIAGGALLFTVSGGEAGNLAAGLFVTVVFVFSARASMWLYGIVMELDTARQAQAQLAVAEERLRFARDVHDVLGRRLSTIAVQAELASTLAARGDERAAAQMLEVRGVAHDALREARELARGYRTTDLTSELEGARSLLRSAGIAVDLHVDDMPRAWHEAAGWVVRESVTNVLRHSSADHVEIAYADGALRVANDGVRPDATADGDGSGLRGLRERLAPLGASLDAACDGADRWTVTAHLPGTGPVSARR